MDTDKQLIDLAYGAMEKAYAPYSGFKVGAALLTQDGNVFTGCNIENISYGATLCAERCAVAAAVAQGERSFTKIAIVSSGEEITMPCGICRQVLAEFMPEGTVILADKQGIKAYTLAELFPHSFNNKF